jgi:hypothetical protein
MVENKEEFTGKDTKRTTLNEYEVKTVIEDIESSGYSIDEVSLEKLETKNPDYYGTKGNPKYKSRRTAVSGKIQDFKRRTPASYLKLVRGYGVEPSKFTLENGEISEKGYEKNKQEPGVTMDVLENQFKSVSLDDHSTAPALPVVPTLTPPRMGMKSPVLNPKKAFSMTDVSPMPSVYAISTSASTLSHSSTPVATGTYERPVLIDVVPNFSGRYANGIWIYEEPKQVKQGKKRFMYQGYLFQMKIDAPDTYLYSASVADDSYIDMLVRNDVISEGDVSCQFVIFRGPYVESFDRVGKGGVISHMWPADECKEVAKTTHTNISAPSETDLSPGPSWYYTVAKFPCGYKFDNRVFSDHDFTITPFESMPNKAKVSSLGNEEVLAFHVMWRVALKGTETLMEEDEQMTLMERMAKKRREQSKN